MSNKKKSVPVAVLVISGVTWLLLFLYFAADAIVLPSFYGYVEGQDYLGVIDSEQDRPRLFGAQIEWQRVMSPDESKIALLKRRSDVLDTYFYLYLLDWRSCTHNCGAGYTHLMDHGYLSRELRDPTLYGETILWSADSSLVAVMVEEQYLFAYDLDELQEITDLDQIEQLLESRDLVNTKP